MRRDHTTRALAYLLRGLARTGASFAIGEEGARNASGWVELRPWLRLVSAVQLQARITAEDCASLVRELGHAAGRARAARPAEPPEPMVLRLPTWPERIAAVERERDDARALVASVERERDDARASVRAAHAALRDREERELSALSTLDEAGALLRRLDKYCREDRARTPGKTRLDRCLREVSGFLAKHWPAPREG